MYSYIKPQSISYIFIRYDVQVTGDSCSRWTRYLSDNHIDAADVECDDSDGASHDACHADLTAFSTDRFDIQQAASKSTWLALLHPIHYSFLFL